MFDDDWVDPFDPINEQWLAEMARVGKIDDEYDVVIWPKDNGDTPHFHIWDSNTRGSKFHTCIKIEKPEYFHHTGKEGVLNTKMKKELIRFLESPYRVKKMHVSNWEMVLSLWNDNESKHNVDEDLPMPDYMQLKG